MKLAESGDLAAATAAIAAVAVVVAAAVAAFLTAATAAVVLGLEFLGGGITHELHNTGITYGLAGQLMVEVHGHLFVGHLGHNALDAHAVLGHHRDDGTRAHVLVVKLAVHMENLFLQFVDQVGVLLAESLLGFEREIKLLTLLQTHDVLLETLDERHVHTEDKRVGMLLVELKDTHLLLGVDNKDLIHELHVFSCLNFLH